MTFVRDCPTHHTALLTRVLLTTAFGHVVTEVSWGRRFLPCGCNVFRVTVETRPLAGTAYPPAYARTRWLDLLRLAWAWWTSVPVPAEDRFLRNLRR